MATAAFLVVNTLRAKQIADIVDRTGLDALRNIVLCSSVKMHSAGVTKIVEYIDGQEVCSAVHT